MNNARKACLDACTNEALRHIAEAVRSVEEDSAFGDEVAKEALAMASLALDRMRRVLDKPVLAGEPNMARGASTLPASEVAA